MKFSELQTLINARRRAQGLEVKPVPQDLISYENQVQQQQTRLDQATREKKPLQELAAIEKLLVEARRRLQHAIERYQNSAESPPTKKV